jgi:hypothetical protein
VSSLDLGEIAEALAKQTDYEHRWLINPQTGEIVLDGRRSKDELHEEHPGRLPAWSGSAMPAPGAVPPGAWPATRSLTTRRPDGSWSVTLIQTCPELCESAWSMTDDVDGLERTRRPGAAVRGYVGFSERESSRSV